MKIIFKTALLVVSTIVALQTQAQAPLSGSYFVGPGFTTEFKTLSEVSAYLNDNGVSGPVTIHIERGTYTDQIELHSVAGTSSINTITFVPQEDSLSVVIRSGSLLNSPVLLDNTSNVKIIHLNLATHPFEAKIISIENGSSNLDISFNNIYAEVEPLTSTRAICGVCFLDIEASSDVIIRGNNIHHISNGVMVSSTLINGQVLRNNIDDFDGTGILLNTSNVNCKVNENIINCTAPFNLARGAQVAFTSGGFEFSGNKIFGNIGYGALFQFLGSKVSPANNITNNIIAGGPDSQIGMAVDYSYNVNIYYNSVQIGTTNSISYGGEFTLDSLTNIKNNIFIANSGIPIAVDQFYFPEDVGLVIDYNNYFTKGSVIGYGPRLLTPVSSLLEWQQTTGWDLHSLNIDPEFNNSTDLHTRNPSLDGKGISVAYPTVDFDGDARAPSPDIGADESVLVAADASVYSVNTTNLCPGGTDIFARIRNNSFNALTSVTIKWSLNGVGQTPILWTGTLATGEVSDPISLGSVNLIANTAYDIVVETQNPNGTADGFTGNDSVEMNDVFSLLKGNYTIGAGGDFATVQEAINVLNNSGVCGPTVFNIKDGSYPGQYVLKKINGANASNRIVFQSQSRDQSKVTMLNDAANINLDYIFQLDTVSFVAFRDITFQANNELFGTSVLFNGAIESMMFDHCKFSAVANGTQRPMMRIGRANISGSSVKYCTFEGGSVAISWSMDTAIAFQSDPASDSIYYNSFNNQESMGASVGGLNTFFVEGNKIKSTSLNSGFLGLSVGSVNGIIQKNIVFARFVGLNVTGCSNTIINNFVTIYRQVNQSNGIGLSASFCGQTTVAFNSVRVLNENPDSYAFGTFVDPANTLIGILKNNVFVSAQAQAMVLSGEIDLVVSDYNDYYTNGSKPFRSNSVEYSSLAEWREFSGNDAHSVSVDPNFVSSDDLHAQNNYLSGRGLAMLVSEDIDGEPRHPSYPTIGADEFGDPILNDITLTGNAAAFLCDQTEDMGLVVKNTSILPLTSFTISWKLNGTPQPDVEWSGELGPDQEVVLLFDNQFEAKASYDLDFDVVSVNELADDQEEGNHRDFTFTVYSKVSLGPDQDTCAGEIILDAGTSYSFYAWSNEEATQTVTVNESGTYSITVLDPNGCGSDDQVTVTIPPQSTPTLEVVGDVTMLCPDTELTLEASGVEGVNFVWIQDDEVIANIPDNTMVIDQPGTYKVRVFVNDCDFTSDILFIDVGVKPAKPVIETDEITSFCLGKGIKIFGPDGATGYKWSNNAQSKDVVVFAGGDYSLRVINEDGCLSDPSDAVEVILKPTPTKPEITTVGNTLVASAGADRYEWVLDENVLAETSGTLVPAEDGSYTVRAFLGDCSAVSDPVNFKITGLETTAEWRFYPNPASRRVTISGNITESVSVTLVDAIGRVFNPAVSNRSTDQLIIDVSEASAGVYFLRVDGNEKVFRSKLVIVK